MAERPAVLARSADGARADQLDSAGSSMAEIVDAAIVAAAPEPGLRWLDIGCGTGDLLRRVRDDWAPASLCGVDLIDWLEEDLRADVSFQAASLEDAELAQADRVMLVEVLEHLPTLRSRLELALRGNLTSFRPDYAPHLSPALPHVTARVLATEGLAVEAPRYAGADVISLTGGRTWPQALRARWPRLMSVSVILAARRPGSAGGRAGG
jgi:SAM-dependent methyltransferase